MWLECLHRPGHFLELSFAAHHLEVHGWHAHNEWVRYIGRGGCVACFHCEPVSPNTVALPPPHIDYNPVLQQDWLRQELQELAKVRSHMCHTCASRRQAKSRTRMTMKCGCVCE
jgi:hypothetical protein